LGWFWFSSVVPDAYLRTDSTSFSSERLLGPTVHRLVE
jgi:hypothetical protein